MRISILFQLFLIFCVESLILSAEWKVTAWLLILFQGSGWKTIMGTYSLIVFFQHLETVERNFVEFLLHNWSLTRASMMHMVDDILCVSINSLVAHTFFRNHTYKNDAHGSWDHDVRSSQPWKIPTRMRLYIFEDTRRPQHSSRETMIAIICKCTYYVVFSLGWNEIIVEDHSWKETLKFDEERKLLIVASVFNRDQQ